MSGIIYPQWFQDGTPVEDIFTASPDAPFIFDEGEEIHGVWCEWSSLGWRRCLVPVDSLFPRRRDLDAHLSTLVERGRGVMPEERARAAGIARWIRSCGGAGRALASAPVLATLRSGRVQLEDGYHRLGVACHLFREFEVPVLCAVVPGMPVSGRQGPQKAL